jgi:hypothetical protein
MATHSSADAGVEQDIEGLVFAGAVRHAIGRAAGAAAPN